MPDPSTARLGDGRSARLAPVGWKDGVGDGCGGETVCFAELVQDVRDMKVCRPLCDVQRRRDLAVGATRGEQTKNLDLARGQAKLAQLVAMGRTGRAALGGF